jgi:hypothetical protein
VIRHALFPALLALALTASATGARAELDADDVLADDDPIVARRPARDVQLRVLSQRATVRTGPSLGYREVYVARRGQTFEVLERARTGYWFLVQLDDGTTGWIPGPDVIAVDTPASRGGVLVRMGRALRRTLMAPPRVGSATGALSFAAGALDREGMFLLRPAIILEPHVALEGTLGMSPRAQSDAFLGGLGLTLRLAPDAIVGPLAHVGLGAAHIRPKADNFVDERKTLMTISAGGGFELTFKKQITVRLEARRWMLFDQNQADGGTELSGGLSVFF